MSARLLDMVARTILPHPPPHAREGRRRSPRIVPDGAFLDRAADALFAARTVLVFGEVNTKLARTVTAQLVALAASGDMPIRMIVHLPGGHVEAGDTIHDAIRAIAPAVTMIGTGWVASAGALIYAAARRENRYALPNTRFLLHQPLEVRAAAPPISRSKRTKSSRCVSDSIASLRGRLGRTTRRSFAIPIATSG